MTRKFPALFAGVLGGVTLPHKPEGSCSENHPYVLRVGDQAQYLKRVDKAGINRCIHYPIALHLTKAYEGLGLIIGNFPVAEAAVSQALSLPMFPDLTSRQQDRVVAGVLKSLAVASSSGSR